MLSFKVVPISSARMRSPDVRTGKVFSHLFRDVMKETDSWDEFIPKGAIVNKGYFDFWLKFIQREINLEMR